jgi:hypothetical protein
LYLDKLRKSFNLNLLILKLEYMGLYLDKLRKSLKLNLLILKLEYLGGTDL